MSVREKLQKVFDDNSERDLLQVLKEYPFLFYELYTRQMKPCPCFYEVEFGNKYRCDFCWLNDNSDGPEWVLVEIEKPKMKCFNRSGEPSKELNHSIEQVKSWDMYFAENPSEKKRIFGCVMNFRFVVVAGSPEEWKSEHAIKWRWYNNNQNKYEVRTSEVFWRSLKIFEDGIDGGMFSIEMKSSSELETYWRENKYISFFRNVFN